MQHISLVELMMNTGSNNSKMHALELTLHILFSLNHFEDISSKSILITNLKNELDYF